MIYVFLHNTIDNPRGGVRNIFMIAQSLYEAGHNVSVLVLGSTPGWRPTWFENTIPVVNEETTIYTNDVVIIHEEGMCHWEWLTQNGAKHIILNQGLQASLINSTYERVRKGYEQSIGVICLSEYIVNGLNKVFGVPYEKLHFVPNVVDSTFKNYYSTKHNEILIMNKCNSIANTMVIEIARGKYPGWKVNLLDNMNRSQVQEAMARAKIFVFLCSIIGEGFGIPPVEAALSGCKVIGYSGLGGREYFKGPVFTEIEYNDVCTLTFALDHYTELLNNETIVSVEPDAGRQIEYLASKYSKEQFKHNVIRTVERMLNG